MKKLWQAAMETKSGDIKENDIFFDVTETSSPYGEATMKNVFCPGGSIEKKIAVNPYYSYESVFGNIIKPGNVPELTKFLCDLILHHLCEIDSFSGMDLEEFYIRFLEEDMIGGAFGTEVSFEEFSGEEIRKISYFYLRLCQTGCYESCFCDILQYLYQHAWVNAREDGSIIVIVNQKHSAQDEIKINTIRSIFLQAGRICHMYWDIPPGIIECRETTLGNFVLF